MWGWVGEVSFFELLLPLLNLSSKSFSLLWSVEKSFSCSTTSFNKYSMVSLLCHSATWRTSSGERVREMCEMKSTIQFQFDKMMAVNCEARVGTKQKSLYMKWDCSPSNNVRLSLTISLLFYLLVVPPLFHSFSCSLLCSTLDSLSCEQ